MALEKGEGYWKGKIPCWEIRNCQGKEGGAPDCPAYKNQAYPCWEMKNTICKGETGTNTYFCSLCKVYLQYSGGKPLPKPEDLKE